MEISSNPFEEDESPMTHNESRMCQEEMVDRINYEDISKQLINDGFILTALELHTEVQEIAKPVGFLRDYFSNPGNFERTRAPDLHSTSPPVGLQRSGSIQTFDSLDWARYSDDGDRQTEDRVAGLEFELRKAQDTIKSLRKALTIATEKDLVSPEDQKDSEATNNTTSEGQYQDTVIKPHEKRAINFLVNEYLLIHDYKLTSVTFAEENENQDFEHWDDVGLNISKPPDLLHLYLDFGKHTAPVTDCSDVETSVNFYQPEIDVLKHQFDQLYEEKEMKCSELNSLNMMNESLNTDIELLKLQKTQLEDKLAEMRVEAETAAIQQSHVTSSQDELDSRPTSSEAVIRELHTYLPVDREIPPRFLEKVLELSFHAPEDNRIAKQVSHIDGNNASTIIEMIAQSLPHIVPNVLLAKREELLPLILCAANLHPSAKSRDRLLNTLFNLIKRPDEHQRQMIVTGCLMFAQYNGPQKVEEELLSQCWEQIGDKHMERRLLVVDACSALIPYMSSSIRGSLVLSMLQQMLLDERIEDIRCSIVRCLAILVCFIDDSDKFSQVMTLYSRNIFTDTSAPVQDITVDVLLPALSQWALTIDKLSGIMEVLFTALQNSLTEPNEENVISVIAESFLPAIKHLHTLVSFQFVSLLYSGPYNTAEPEQPDGELSENDSSFSKDRSLSHVQYLISSQQQYEELSHLYTEYISEEWYKTWDQFDLLVYTPFSRLVMIALSMPTDDLQVVRSLVDYVSIICKTVGQRVTVDKIEPKMTEFFKLDEDITPQHYKIYSSALLPMLVCGVKSANITNPDDVSELMSYLKKCIIKMSQWKVPMSAMESTISLLLENEELTESVMDSLLELTVQSTSLVKINTAILLKTSILCSRCAPLLNSKILPALSNLITDTDVDVRTSTISPLGSTLESSSNRDILELVFAEFIKLLDDVNQTKDVNMLLQLISTFSRVGPNTEPQFRENVIISHLTAWSRENNNSGDTIRRRNVAVRLIDAYSALSCCSVISQRVSQETFLPGLRHLHTDLKELGLDGVSVIQSMINDAEAKIGANNSSSNNLMLGPHVTGMPSPALGRMDRERKTSTNVLNKLGRDLFSKRK